jgi:hypothetical protein
VSVVLGTAKWRGSGTIANQNSSYTRVEECWDVIGNYGGQNPFELERTSNLVYTVSGNNDIGAFKQWDYGGWGFTSPPGSHMAASSSEPSDNAAFSKALALTNPNKPYVDLPVFGAELRDIPGLIKHALEAWAKGIFSRYRTKDLRALSREAGSDYLTYQFGVSPVVRDLMKMMDFLNQVERRIRMLEALLDREEGLNRSATVWENTSTFTPWVKPLTPFYNDSNTIELVWTTERRKWVSTKWKLEGNLPLSGNEDLRALANRLTFGQYASLSMIWELMPWSWLIDWFGNLGDLLNGQRNYLPVSHSGSCLMTKTLTRPRSWKVVNRVGTWSLTLSPETRVHLKRVVLPVAPHPEFSIPFLDGRQLSILSAISVTRK